MSKPEGRTTTHSSGRAWLVPPDLTGAVTLGELGSVAAAIVVATVALSSLAAAHLRVLTLATAMGGTAVVLLALGGLAFVAGKRPRVALDLPGLAILVLTLVVAAWFYLPGFHYAAGDRDPGGYVMHAVSMARTHSYDLVDPVVRDGLPYGLTLTDPPSRFLGASIADPATGQTIPGFYHLWPALLATAWNLHGWGGLSNTTPLVAIVSALVVVALTRRVTLTASRRLSAASGVSAVSGVSGKGSPSTVTGIASVAATGVAGALMATNMLQVWQAKYPTAEVLSQLLFVSATLLLAISLDTGWRWPAGVGGLFVGLGFLARADGVLIVVALIALGEVLWVLRRFDARSWWCAAGLGVVLPYALWQAYGPAKEYTTANEHIPLGLLVGGIAATLGLAALLRILLPGFARSITSGLESRRVQRWLGKILLGLVLALFVLGLLRPALFGEDLLDYHGRIARSYDEITLYRLAWFFTWPGWALALVGAAWVLLRRWRANGWLVLAPLLGLLPLYAWHAHNSTFLMWWGRRFVPTVLVGLVVLTAAAVGWLVARSLAAERVRLLHAVVGVLGVGAAAVAIVTGVTSSLPLRAHDEWGGSYDVERSLTEVDGQAPGSHAVYLWQPATYCCAPPVTLFAGPLWMIWDQTSVLLPQDEAAVPATVLAYVKHFPGEPVYLVYDHGAGPPPIPGATTAPVEHFVGSLPRWEESSVTRPAAATSIPYNFQVYRVDLG